MHRDDEGAGSFPPAFHFISRFLQSMVYHFPTEDSLFNFVQGVGQKSGGDEWQLVIKHLFMIITIIKMIESIVR
ncbi:hypothetical protein GGQ77_002685 [Geobacillus thermodenitrificans]|nr:hypothetical protein [Geobacillus thermodenitrificans]